MEIVCCVAHPWGITILKQEHRLAQKQLEAPSTLAD